MNDRGNVRLRDQRKPGHCWQDNELYDVFQPIIGHHGVALYANLSRRAYGENFKTSLRELEEITGMSRMTVWRTMAILEHLGMVRLKAGRGPVKGEYVLVDLKELAEALGARPIQNGKSHEMDEATTARLGRECAAVRARLGGKDTPADCVPQRDATDSGKTLVCVPPRDACGTVVSQNEGLCVPPEGHATSSLFKTNTQDINPPLPLPPAGGDAREEICAEDRDRLLDEGAAEVATRCGITARGVVRAIRGQLALRWSGGLGDTVALMASSWQVYTADADLMRFTWGPRKFFGEGHWVRPATWPIDQERLQMARQARVGMA